MAKEYLVVTVIGPDKRGIVAKITAVILNMQANIEESRMVRLGGEFAVLMLISTTMGVKDQLSETLSNLDWPDVKIYIKGTDLARVKVFEGFVPFVISVIGADHEGIVHAVAEYLAEARIQVEEMETTVVPAPITGTPLFSMQAEVQVPPELTLSILRKKLHELEDDLGVDIDIRLPVS